mgnify:CR=1 FL=1|jgi:DNA-binding MarR family transcriptional regulator
MGKQDKKSNILASIFSLANKIQSVGDAMMPAVTMKQFQLLDTISKSQKLTMSLSELAFSIGSSRQNVKKMALILEKQGLLMLSKDKNDARVLLVGLTEQSAACLRERSELDGTYLNDLFDGLDNKTLKVLAKSCDRISKNVNAIEARNLKKQSPG